MPRKIRLKGEPEMQVVLEPTSCHTTISQKKVSTADLREGTRRDLCFVYLKPVALGVFGVEENVRDDELWVSAVV